MNAVLTLFDSPWVQIVGAVFLVTGLVWLGIGFAAPGSNNTAQANVRRLEAEITTLSLRKKSTRAKRAELHEAKQSLKADSTSRAKGWRGQ